MVSERDLVIGFSEEEKQKIIIHLEKLLPYLKPGGFVIVGGLAIRYHLLSHGISYPKRPFNDLDIIVKSSDAVSRSVSKDFLVYHYHPEGFFLALVDPVSRTKVDIFNFDFAPRYTESVRVGNYSVKIRSIEDQLCKTVFDIQRISSMAKVDPKQFLDARLLFQIADLKIGDEIWKSHKIPNLPTTISAALERAERIAEKHPEWLQEKPFRKQRPYRCSQCRSTDGFEVVPMDQVYKILGYTEW